LLSAPVVLQPQSIAMASTMIINATSVWCVTDSLSPVMSEYHHNGDLDARNAEKKCTFT